MNPSGHAFGGSSRCPDCHQCINQGVDVGAAEQVFRPGGRVVGETMTCLVFASSLTRARRRRCMSSSIGKVPSTHHWSPATSSSRCCWSRPRYTARRRRSQGSSRRRSRRCVGRRSHLAQLVQLPRRAPVTRLAGSRSCSQGDPPTQDRPRPADRDPPAGQRPASSLPDSRLHKVDHLNLDQRRSDHGRP